MNLEYLNRRFFLGLFIFWQLIFLILPLFILFIKGFLNPFILNDFIWIFKCNYLSIFFRTFFFAFLTAVICLIIGYSVSYIVYRQRPLVKNILLFLMAIPFLTNFIIHIITWSTLLQKHGPVYNFLVSMKIFGENFNLLFTSFSVLIGYVYCFMPFMIFPLYNSLSKLNKSLIEASSDLGASFTKTLFKVIIPMTKQGIYTGFFLVLVSASGEFVIPEILGGDRFIYCGNVFSTVLLNSSLIEKGSLVSIFFIFLLATFSLFSYLILRYVIKFLEKF